MQIKMTNNDKINEETKIKFYEYMSKTSKDFYKEANKYIDNLFAFKNIFTYVPSSMIIKACIYIMYFFIVFEVVNILNCYINFTLYNMNTLNQIIISFIILIFQFLIVMYILYMSMTHDIEYRHECFLKFIHSDCVKQYEEKLLKKASELGLELEVIHDDN